MFSGLQVAGAAEASRSRRASVSLAGDKIWASYYLDYTPETCLQVLRAIPVSPEAKML